MLWLIAVVAAFVGTTVAAAFDLKTTEIPDQIPYIMIAAGLIIAAANSYLQWNYWPLALSIIVGACLTGFGFLMYYFGQWGGGDVKILAAVGCLLPELPMGFAPQYWLGLPFPLSYLFNVFFIGTGYMLLYAVVVALRNKKIIAEFFKQMKSSGKIMVIGVPALFVIFFAINSYLANLFGLRDSLEIVLTNSLLPLAATMFLFVIWKFSKAVEDVGFKKKIPISKLRVGDILFESRELEGITTEQLKKIKKSGKKFVTIKEGVRFAPAFTLALLFTLYYGDSVFMLIHSLG